MSIANLGNTHVITSGPALATVSQEKQYLSLLNVEAAPYLVATIITDHSAKSRTLAIAGAVDNITDVLGLLRFVTSYVNTNGGQPLNVVNNDVTTIVPALIGASAASKGTSAYATQAQEALSGIDCVLNASSPTQTIGVYNNVRFTKEMIYTMPLDILGTATMLALTITKGAPKAPTTA